MSTQPVISNPFEARSPREPARIAPGARPAVLNDTEAASAEEPELPRLPTEPGRNSRYLALINRPGQLSAKDLGRHYLSREEGRWYLWRCHRQSPDSLDFTAEKGFLKLTPTWQLLAWCVDTDQTPMDACNFLLRTCFGGWRRLEHPGHLDFDSHPSKLSIVELHINDCAVQSITGGRSP